MGEILVDFGYLKRRELLPAVRRHVEDVVYSLFAWESGNYIIVAGTGAQDEKIRLATHPAVVAPINGADTAQARAEADLSPEERQAADLFDGRRTIAEVAGSSRVD